MQEKQKNIHVQCLSERLSELYRHGEKFFYNMFLHEQRKHKIAN